MGLFSKKSSSNNNNSKSYAPPSGPPPSNYTPGQPYGASPPQQQQQQYYAPPPGPPHGQYGQYQPPPVAQAPAPAPRGGAEDPLSALAKYDTAFLVDDSGSMEMFWDDLSLALASVIQKAVHYDSDGVDISFLNHPAKATSKSAEELLSLFTAVFPSKSTPMKTALRRVLEPYMSDLENWLIEGKPTGYPRPKPLNLIVLTDGAPDRNENPESVIVDIAQRLDKGRFPPYQIGIQMVQIGTDDEAADHLRSLDDDLKTKYNIRDMVDTTLFDASKGTVNEAYLLKALLGGINRSIDKTN